MLSYYTGMPRATVDVDFIISGADLSLATKVIDKAYVQFKQNDQIYHITYDSKKSNLKDPERIDLVKDGFPLFREIVKKYCITLSGSKHTMKIPTIEAAIALKFAASISPNRAEEDKPIDHTDLLRLVRANSNLDTQRLFKLGEFIYNGGGKELVCIVEDINNGKHIIL